MGPAGAGRYDPYDPHNPMWTDPFWAAYCVNPLRPAESGVTGRVRGPVDRTAPASAPPSRC